jgi:SAM-dependent methyltransferase
MPTDFERLIAEAESQPFSGWDFSYLKGRYLEGKPSWNFAQEARRVIQEAHSMLDMATGGGEFLSSLSPLPEICCATEGYLPNSRVALERLRPVGVGLVFTFWDDNDIEPQRGALPFRGGAFDIVMDRHESFLAREVARVLTKDGIFLTQQVGSTNNSELREFFGKSPDRLRGEGVPWNLASAVKEIESAGMKILEKKEERMSSKFLDVGAVAYYLKAIPWELPGFSARTHNQQLLELHRRIEKKGSFEVTTTRFYVKARKE